MRVGAFNAAFEKKSLLKIHCSRCNHIVINLIFFIRELVFLNANANSMRVILVGSRKTGGIKGGF